MTKGKPRAAQIDRQIAATTPKTTLSIFSVTDLKDIAFGSFTLAA
jgi:hypothetical protein